MVRIRRMILDSRRRTPCPVCLNRVAYPWHEPGDDVTEGIVPVHSEGLIGSGRRCYAAGLEGSEAAQMRDDWTADPALPLRAHP